MLFDDDPRKHHRRRMLTKNQKLGLGIVVLLIVDVIWVASSELTKVSAKVEANEVQKLTGFDFSSCIKMKTTTSPFSAHFSRLRSLLFTLS